MTRRLSLLFASLCGIILVYILFTTKEQVLNMRAELAVVKAELQKEKDFIQVLHAEFAYLSSPKRLIALNDKYLQLQATKLAQIDENIGDAKPTYAENSRRMVASKARNAGWRYKKGSHQQYLTLTSMKK